MKLNRRQRQKRKKHRGTDGSENCSKPPWDLTANIHNLLTEGFTLRGGIRNLFGRRVSDPSPVFKYEDGTVGYNYRDDLPRPGREWFL